MTTKQQQCLLAYHGHYTGLIDGIWGKLSAAACSKFQKECGIPATGVCNVATEEALRHSIARDLPNSSNVPSENSTELEELFRGIKYWSPQEFKCRCGEYHAPYCNGFPALPSRKLLELADNVREHFGKPGHRSSGVRCVQHNADQPGAAVDSRHLRGKALDFRIEDATATQVLAYVKTLPDVRYAYCIDSSYVHMDVD